MGKKIVLSVWVFLFSMSLLGMDNCEFKGGYKRGDLKEKLTVYVSIGEKVLKKHGQEVCNNNNNKKVNVSLYTRIQQNSMIQRQDMEVTSKKTQEDYEETCKGESLETIRFFLHEKEIRVSIPGKYGSYKAFKLSLNLKKKGWFLNKKEIMDVKVETKMVGGREKDEKWIDITSDVTITRTKNSK